MFCKYARRSSDIAEEGALFDNSLIIAKILKLRYQQAKILGFSNPAELSLATKMANSPEDVVVFLKELAAKAKPFAQKNWMKSIIIQIKSNPSEKWSLGIFRLLVKN